MHKKTTILLIGLILIGLMLSGCATNSNDTAPQQSAQDTQNETPQPTVVRDEGTENQPEPPVLPG